MNIYVYIQTQKVVPLDPTTCICRKIGQVEDYCRGNPATNTQLSFLKGNAKLVLVMGLWEFLGFRCNTNRDESWVAHTYPIIVHDDTNIQGHFLMLLFYCLARRSMPADWYFVFVNHPLFPFPFPTQLFYLNG